MYDFIGKIILPITSVADYSHGTVTSCAYFLSGLSRIPALLGVVGYEATECR
jgi:hypothetical protein